MSIFFKLYIQLIASFNLIHSYEFFWSKPEIFKQEWYWFSYFLEIYLVYWETKAYLIINFMINARTFIYFLNYYYLSKRVSSNFDFKRNEDLISFCIKLFQISNSNLGLFTQFTVFFTNSVSLEGIGNTS